MLTGKNVVIISANQLQCLGLKAILEEYFYPEKIMIFRNFADARPIEEQDYIFMPSDLYLAHNSQIKTAKNRIVIFTNHMIGDGIHDGPDMLNITLPQAEIIDKLKTIFQKTLKDKRKIQSQMLSQREIEVLKLVARGYINKQIADKLFISQHTVISHRKNITRKLGIKTVSGLTVYALLNGLISSKEIS
jgi:DNA-binding CsgD family transcriptional regulator